MPSSAPVHAPRLAPGLIAREVDGDLVVVDERTQSAHALSGAVAEAYRALARGEMPSGTEIESRAALRELASKDLLEPSTMSRRLMLQRAGVVAVAGGVITIGLPSVAAASSHPPGGNTTPKPATILLSWTVPKKNDSSTATVTVTGDYGAAQNGTVTVIQVTGLFDDSNIGKSATVSGGLASLSLKRSNGSAVSGTITLRYSGGDGADGPYSQTDQTFTRTA